MDNELNQILKEVFKIGYEKIINDDGKNNFIILGEDKNIIINKHNGNYFAYSLEGECRPITLTEHKLIHRLLYHFQLLNYE